MCPPRVVPVTRRSRRRAFWKKSRPFAAMGAALLLAGCVTEPPRARSLASPATALDRTGPPPIPERDRVLFDYRAGVAALRAGQDAEAKAKLDDAIARIGGIITNDAAAARARSLFSAESTKTFIGEPYERVMAY